MILYFEFLKYIFCCCSVMSDSLQPHGLQHARHPCPSPSPGTCSNSCPLNHDAIQPSHPLPSPFSSCLRSFPASRSFLMSQFFASSGQSIGSFCFSISPSNKYSGLISFKIDWFDLLVVQGTLALNAVMLRGSVKRHFRARCVLRSHL